MRPETMTMPQEDPRDGASVDVVGGGELTGYSAWKSNQKSPAAETAALLEPKSKL
eukprot:SAG22_NODE_1_length_62449_cov_158.689270_45_plen_55_part_00